MSSKINAISAGVGGLATSADASGILELQTNDTTAITVDGSQVVSFDNNFGTVAGLPSYQCRAWVNFNGTGTVAIRASGNVSSITDNGTGDYTVNFTTAMVDANYCVSLGQVGYWNTNTVTTLLIKAGASPNTTIPAIKTTTQLNVMYSDTSATATYYDCNEANVAVFR